MQLRQAQQQVSISPRGLALLFWEASDLFAFETEEVAARVLERLDVLVCTSVPAIASESSLALAEGGGDGDPQSRLEVTTTVVARWLWKKRQIR